MSLFQGWLGEMKAIFYMWLSIDKKTYRKFHNLILPSVNGTTQIDHLLVSEYGLFIIETKNKRGWIFGSEYETEWTQTFYRQSFQFQNPLRQTFRQKKVLSEFLNLDEYCIHTVVYFVGNCSFRTAMPNNVIRSGIGKYVHSFREQILTEQNVDSILNTLNGHVSNSKLRRKDHLKSLHQRHTSLTTCPKCGLPLVERTARQGSNSGNKFLGCTGYPKCRFVKNI